MTRQGGRREARRASARLEIDLDDIDAFRVHPLVAPFKERYQRNATLAEHAILRLVEDLEALNEQCLEANGRVAFTAVQGRVKEEFSFLKKMWTSCRALAQAKGLSQGTLEAAFAGIKDVAGVRFSCPYFDEVAPAVDNLVRPRLAARGYGTNLGGEAGYEDKNHLDQGDEVGYRAYHFFVHVPTVVDIYGTVQPCLCEVQARTELQHVWADKSHDLLYKLTTGWDFRDPRVVEVMRQVSNNLRSVDGYLVDIRSRTRGEGT